MTSSKRKDRRKRTRVNVSFSREDYDEIERKAGGRSLSEFCRERILFSENYHDPMFEIAAKLNALSVVYQQFREVLAQWDMGQIEWLVSDYLERRNHVDHEFRALVREGIELASKIDKEASKATRLLARKVAEERRIQPTKRGRPKP